MTRVHRRPALHLALVRSVERWYFSLRRSRSRFYVSFLSQKSHRLLPTNLYVILYNFKSRHQDELDLKAGDKVTVIDFSDPDWWKGKCLGRTGYFPSKYCSKLAAGERPLQVCSSWMHIFRRFRWFVFVRWLIIFSWRKETTGWCCCGTK